MSVSPIKYIIVVIIVIYPYIPIIATHNTLSHDNNECSPIHYIILTQPISFYPTPYPTRPPPHARLYHTIPHESPPPSSPPIIYHTKPYHTILYHTILLPISYHTIPYDTLSYHTISRTVNLHIPHHTIPYHMIPYHTISCDILYLHSQSNTQHRTNGNSNSNTKNTLPLPIAPSPPLSLLQHAFLPHTRPGPPPSYHPIPSRPYLTISMPCHHPTPHPIPPDPPTSYRTTLYPTAPHPTLPPPPLSYTILYHTIHLSHRTPLIPSYTIPYHTIYHISYHATHDIIPSYMLCYALSPLQVPHHTTPHGHSVTAPSSRSTGPGSSWPSPTYGPSEQRTRRKYIIGINYMNLYIYW